MAVRNAAALLPDALASIPPSMGRSGASYEIVVADGASDDDTVAIASQAPHARLVSRSDGGLYDGMNRAIAAATGATVLLLNGDDELLPGGIAAALDALEREPSKAFASGLALFGAQRQGATLRRYSGPLSPEGIIFGVPAINARVFRRAVLERAGPLRTDLGLAADREYLLRLVQRNEKGAAVEQPIYFYRSHEGSKTLVVTREGAQRVYRANAQFAAHLVESSSASERVRSLARAELAVDRLKLRLTGADGSDSRSPDTGIFDLLQGIRQAVRWRGVLSGV